MCCDHSWVSGNSVPIGKMAEEFKAVASSCKKKLKQCGSYNQYLCEPGTKIPRTTLKRWPKTTLETTSISPSAENWKDDLDITSSKYSNATCSVISSSIVTETAPVELTHRFLHQTELSPEKASSIRLLHEHAVDNDDNQLPFETQSDESNLQEGDFEEICKSTESEQATIELTISSEDDGEQDSEREYLDALISEECADN